MIDVLSSYGFYTRDVVFTAKRFLEHISNVRPFRGVKIKILKQVVRRYVYPTHVQ